MKIKQIEIDERVAFPLFLLFFLGSLIGGGYIAVAPAATWWGKLKHFGLGMVVSWVGMGISFLFVPGEMTAANALFIQIAVDIALAISVVLP